MELKYDNLSDYKLENLQCYMCFITFRDPKSKARHMKKTHGEIYKQQLQLTETQFSCYKCDKIYSTSEELSEHSATHNQDEKSFQCRYCRATFYTFTEVTKHRRWDCGKRQCPCKDCGIKFPNPSRLNQHRLKVHSPRAGSQKEEDLTYKCQKCDCIFQNEDELIDHQERDLDCSISEPKPPPKKRGRPPKSEKQSGMKKTQSANCDLVFPSVDALRAHKKQQHSKPSRKLHTCTECDQSFTEAHQLTVHMATDHCSEECSCPTCGEVFSDTNNLTYHMSTHCKKEEPEFNVENIHARRHWAHLPLVRTQRRTADVESTYRECTGEITHGAARLISRHCSEQSILPLARERCSLLQRGGVVVNNGGIGRWTLAPASTPGLSIQTTAKARFPGRPAAARSRLRAEKRSKRGRLGSDDGEQAVSGPRPVNIGLAFSEDPCLLRLLGVTEKHGRKKDAGFISSNSEGEEDFAGFGTAAFPHSPIRQSQSPQSADMSPGSKPLLGKIVQKTSKPSVIGKIVPRSRKDSSTESTKQAVGMDSPSGSTQTQAAITSAGRKQKKISGLRRKERESKIKESDGTSDEEIETDQPSSDARKRGVLPGHKQKGKKQDKDLGAEEIKHEGEKEAKSAQHLPLLKQQKSKMCPKEASVPGERRERSKSRFYTYELVPVKQEATPGLSEANGSTPLTASGRSSRVIKMPKRFLDEDVTPTRKRNYKVEDSFTPEYSNSPSGLETQTSQVKSPTKPSPGSSQDIYKNLKKLTSKLAERKKSVSETEGEPVVDAESSTKVRKRKRRSKIKMEEIDSPGAIRKLAVSVDPNLGAVATETTLKEEVPAMEGEVIVGQSAEEVSGMGHRFGLSGANKRMLQRMLRKAKVQLIKIDQQKQLKMTQESMMAAGGRRQRRRKHGLHSKEYGPQEQPLAGPRIKHVCRAAAVALGQPRAMVPDDIPRLSALPLHEREGISFSPTIEGAVADEDELSDQEANEWAPVQEPVTLKRRVRKRKFRKSRSQYVPGGVRSRRCGECDGCMTEKDCAKCAMCLDKPKFGGFNVKKQCCIYKRCERIERAKLARILKPYKIKSKDYVAQIARTLVPSEDKKKSLRNVKRRSYSSLLLDEDDTGNEENKSRTTNRTSSRNQGSPPPSQEQAEQSVEEMRSSLPDQSPPRIPLPKLQIHLHRLPDSVLQASTQAKPKFSSPLTNSLNLPSPQVNGNSTTTSVSLVQLPGPISQSLTQAEPKTLSSSPIGQSSTSPTSKVPLDSLPGPILQSDRSVKQSQSLEGSPNVKLSPTSTKSTILFSSQLIEQSPTASPSSKAPLDSLPVEQSQLADNIQAVTNLSPLPTKASIPLSPQTPGSSPTNPTSTLVLQLHRLPDSLLPCGAQTTIKISLPVVKPPAPEERSLPPKPTDITSPSSSHHVPIPSPQPSAPEERSPPPKNTDITSPSLSHHVHTPSPQPPASEERSPPPKNTDITSPSLSHHVHTPSPQPPAPEERSPPPKNTDITSPSLSHHVQTPSPQPPAPEERNPPPKNTDITSPSLSHHVHTPSPQPPAPEERSPPPKNTDITSPSLSHHVQTPSPQPPAPEERSPPPKNTDITTPSLSHHVQTPSPQPPAPEDRSPPPKPKDISSPSSSHYVPIPSPQPPAPEERSPLPKNTDITSPSLSHHVQTPSPQPPAPEDRSPPPKPKDISSPSSSHYVPIPSPQPPAPEERSPLPKNTDITSPSLSHHVQTPSPQPPAPEDRSPPPKPKDISSPSSSHHVPIPSPQPPATEERKERIPPPKNTNITSPSLSRQVLTPSPQPPAPEERSPPPKNTDITCPCVFCHVLTPSPQLPAPDERSSPPKNTDSTSPSSSHHVLTPSPQPPPSRDLNHCNDTAKIRLSRLPDSILHSTLSLPPEWSDPKSSHSSPYSRRGSKRHCTSVDKGEHAPPAKKCMHLRLHRLPNSLVQASLHKSTSPQKTSPCSKKNFNFNALKALMSCCPTSPKCQDQKTLTVKDNFPNTDAPVPTEIVGLDTESSNGTLKDPKDNFAAGAKEDGGVVLGQNAVVSFCLNTDTHYFLRPQNPLEYASLNGTGLTNGFSLKAPLQIKHKIRVDFKEDCALENVWLMGGLSVLASLPNTPQPVCLLCASQGQHEMLYCQICCEPFHSFCLLPEERPQEENKENWCCRRCKFCHVCGRKSKSSKPVLQCRRCQTSYHPSCLGPTYPKPLNCDVPWVCMTCIRCRSCGVTRGKTWDLAWNQKQDLCPDCTELYEKGNFCTICQKCYEDNSQHEQIQCSKCNRWIHAKCEGISEELFELFSSLPEEMPFTCSPCSAPEGSMLKGALQSRLTAQLQEVLTDLLSSSATQHLLICKRCYESRPPEYNREHSICDLHAVEKNFKSALYDSVKTFHVDVSSVLSKWQKEEESLPDDQKRTNAAKDHYVKLMERIFVWFPHAQLKNCNSYSEEYPSGMLPEAVLPPSKEHSYAQWLERSYQQRTPLSNLSTLALQTRGFVHDHEYNKTKDGRQCMLCQQNGDAPPSDQGRLLYMGQNEWAHINCCLWSAEVYEDNGALLQVHSAVSRGRHLRCDRCGQSGATVGCCLMSCQSNFHFMCARVENCVFQHDRKVYCNRHRELISDKVVEEFEEVSNGPRTGVNKHVNWLSSYPQTGILTELHQMEERCTPSDIITEVSTPLPGEEQDAKFDQGENHTIVHSPNHHRDLQSIECESYPVSPIKSNTPSPKTHSAGSKSPIYPHARRPAGGSSRPLPSPGTAPPKPHHIVTLRDLEDTRRTRRLSSRSRCSSSPQTLTPAPPRPIALEAQGLPFSAPLRALLLSAPSRLLFPAKTLPRRSGARLSVDLSAILREDEVPQDFLASSEAEDAAVATTNGISLAPDNLEEEVAQLMSQELPYTVFDADVAVDQMLNAKLEFDDSLLTENIAFSCQTNKGEGESASVDKNKQDNDPEDDDSKRYLKFSRTVVDVPTSSETPNPNPAQSISQLDGADGENGTFTTSRTVVQPKSNTAEDDDEDESSSSSSSSSDESAEEFKDDLTDPDYAPELDSPKKAQLPGKPIVVKRATPTPIPTPPPRNVNLVLPPQHKVRLVVPSPSVRSSPGVAKVTTVSSVPRTVTSPIVINGLNLYLSNLAATANTANAAATPPQVLLVNRQGQILIKDPRTNTYQAVSTNTPAYNKISQIAKILHSGSPLQRSVPRVIVKPQTAAPSTISECSNQANVATIQSPTTPLNSAPTISLTTPVPLTTATPATLTIPATIAVSSAAENNNPLAQKRIVFRMVKTVPTQSPATSPVTVKTPESPLTPKEEDPAQAIIEKAMATHREVEKTKPIIIRKGRKPKKEPIQDGNSGLFSGTNQNALLCDPSAAPQTSLRSQVRVKRVSSLSERPNRKKSKLDCLIDASDPEEGIDSKSSGVRIKAPSMKDILDLDEGNKIDPESFKIVAPPAPKHSRYPRADVSSSDGDIDTKTHKWVSSRHGDLSEWGPYSGVSSEDELSALKFRKKTCMNQPHLRFEITSDDGFSVKANSIEVAWRAVIDGVLEARADFHLKQLPLGGMNGPRVLGLLHDAVVFLLEQLQGAADCKQHRFRFHRCDNQEEELPLNPSGCARAEVCTRKATFDMFNFLASQHRALPEIIGPFEEEDDDFPLKSSRRFTSTELPMAMRFRHLEKISKEAVGVYRSAIHGRGLFCKRNIESGEMVIEYAGAVIRAVLTDKREKYYDSKGIGCYMFRIDDFDVVDATMQGNAARFINHSCEPNCYSRVINVDGRKHIVIFALRKIYRGEELTYDYKFPIEDEDSKLHCNCGARRCRRFLN
ncbi:hypothetical protein WMY93_019764 [Mugilogobius chulae]|uniref:[histone H3]-lysine(4) N-methyltransferase n=2 Tax=Gobiidae TaxID=8220 RepID=A0AAW0NM46_9GOBI